MGIQQSYPPSTQNSEKIIYRRTEKPYHRLYSPRDQHKDFVWKKWKFTCIDKAQQQLRKLITKMNAPNQFVTSVLDAQFTKTNKGIFNVRAKVQFSQKSLKSIIEEQVKREANFSEGQIWAIVSRIIEIARHLKQIGEDLPSNYSSYLKFGNNIKVIDTQVLPEIKYSKLQKQQTGSIISRIVADLALLHIHSSEITLVEVNRINLKFSVNLATFIYCLRQSNLCIQKIGQLSKRLQNQTKYSTCKISVLTSVTEKHSKPSPIQALQKNMHTTTHSNLQTEMQVSRLGDRLIKKSTSVNILPNQNAKRIQQIRPKDHKNLIQESVRKQHPAQTKRVQLQESQNKQNQGDNNIIQSHRQQIPLIKSSIEIQNHNFPKKLKQFKRASTTASQLNLDSVNSQIRNEAFIKLTGGSRCELFGQDGDDQLLQSIIESQESIIIKDNQSPLLSLDQEMDQIAQDFLKLQSSFNTAEKQEIKSVIEFMYQRNSTIMQVTEQNEQSANDQIKISNIKNSPQQVSNFQIEQENSITYDEEQRFVIQQYEGGSRYEGYTLHGLRNGFGKLYYEDGGSYEGSWKKGEIQGFGKLFYQSGDLAYEGYWSQGEFHGEGKIINEKPQEIKGSFNFTDFSQVGTAWVWYEGNFQNDHKNGSGTLMLSNGQKLTSIWKKNNVDGQGTFVTLFNRKIRGKWKNNILQEIYEDQIDSIDNDFQMS